MKEKRETCKKSHTPSSTPTTTTTTATTPTMPSTSTNIINKSNKYNTQLNFYNNNSKPMSQTQSSPSSNVVNYIKAPPFVTAQSGTSIGPSSGSSTSSISSSSSSPAPFVNNFNKTINSTSTLHNSNNNPTFFPDQQASKNRFIDNFNY
jgi:hypothetical protein